MMIKRIIPTLIAALSILPMVAEEKPIPIRGYKGNSDKVEQPVKHRSPMYLPIEVMYDDEAMTVEVSCSTDLEAEVYLYDASGALEDYSPCLNAVLSVSDSQYHTILIEGDGWEAMGVIE